jgi:hypothetical protein
MIALVEWVSNIHLMKKAYRIYYMLDNLNFKPVLY